MATHTRIFTALHQRTSSQIFSHRGTRPSMYKTVTKYPGLGNVLSLKMTNSSGLSICCTIFIHQYIVCSDAAGFGIRGM